MITTKTPMRPIGPDREGGLDTPDSVAAFQPSEPVVCGLAARKKDRTRRELAEAAMELFIARGYDATTIEEISAAAEVSPRTFYRYFPTKEDLITAISQTSMAGFYDQVRARPPSEPPLQAVGAAIAAAFAEPWRDVDRMRSFLRLLDDAPALRARWLEEAHHHRARLAEVIGPRLGADPTSLRAMIAAGSIILAWNTALEQWSTQGGIGDLNELVGEALQLLAEPILGDSRARPDSP